MPPINLLIKPASSNCNLKCKYCFYHDVAVSRQIQSYGIMDFDTLEIIVRKALDYADNICTFGFQGGEPTLVGLDFFIKLVELEKKYNKKGVKIQNALQTNGMIINEKWAKFLSKNNFLVGISLDGPKDIHDRYRVDINGKGSFTKVMKTIDLFNKHGVDYNILTVVNGSVAKHASKIYNFFKKQGFKYLQFIPCLDPFCEPEGQHEYSLTSEKYALFLKTLFDKWYNDIKNGNKVSIRYFDNLIDMILGYRPESCDMKGYCSCQFIMEADGGTYPCDFYVTDEWYLGNIKDKTFEDLGSSETASRFVQVSQYIDPECKSCKWINLCRGGCRRNREPITNGRPNLNNFCSSYREFFEYTIERLYEIAQLAASGLINI